MNDERSGFGTLSYKDGSKYAGNWVKDKREGKGLYTLHDGSIYDGFFKDD